MRRIRFKELHARPGCADMHITRLKDRETVAPHTHDFFEVFLVLEGAGTHHLNRRKIPLLPGHLVVIRPEDGHGFSTEPGLSLVFVNVAVSRPWWQAFHTLLGLPPWIENHRALVLDPGAARRLGAELSGAALAADPGAVVRAWSRVREHFTLPVGQHADEPPAWLEALRRKLSETPDNLVEPIAFWQKLSGRSPEHVARSCRRFYGVTFSELINRARIERARYLLRTTEEKVITVAFDCGFQNLANFHRVFARLCGQTPSAWRRKGTAAVPVDYTISRNRPAMKDMSSSRSFNLGCS